MSFLVPVLALDPATPAGVLIELAHLPDLAAQDAFLLAAHGNLPDAYLPAWEVRATPARRMNHPTKFRHPYVRPLHTALTSPAANTHTRARLVAHLPASLLIEYTDTEPADAHPAAHTELLHRAAPGLDDPDVELCLALHHDTPDERRLTALKRALTQPSTSDTTSTQLTTVAVRYPQHLPALAAAAHPDSPARVMLARYVAALEADPGVDVAALHRNAFFDEARTRALLRVEDDDDLTPYELADQAAAPWIVAIQAGDPQLAHTILDIAISGAGPTRPALYACVKAVRDCPLLRGTSAWRRAQLIGTRERKDATTLPAHTWETDDAFRRATITHADAQTAHRTAARVGPHDPRAGELLHAGWSQPLGPQDDGVLPVRALYALHPAVPEQRRHTYIDRFTSGPPAIPNHFDADDRAIVAAISHLVAHARTWSQLHQALLDTPVPHLERLTATPSGDDLITHHLGHALRPHHNRLRGDTLTIALTLADTFPGTLAELLHTAGTIAA